MIIWDKTNNISFQIFLKTKIIITDENVERNVMRYEIELLGRTEEDEIREEECLEKELEM
jgi:hypothetical protein